jgi:hypothetical protein
MAIGKSRYEHCLPQADFKDALDSFENKCFAVWTYKEKRKNSRATYDR